jgi:hypothetical protein
VRNRNGRNGYPEALFRGSSRPSCEPAHPAAFLPRRMFFSTNPGLFRHPSPCNLNNGTTVYFDPTVKDLDCSCLAQIRADPDFAGPGVIASYFFIGWLTILVAAVPAFYLIHTHWKQSRGPNRIVDFIARLLQFEPTHQTSSRSSTPPAPDHDPSRDSVPTLATDGKNDEEAASPASLDVEPIYCEFARAILRPLCDLQIITGIAMLIAALAQLPQLSYYHQQFAVQFWWVTLNSFWVSRIDYSRNTADMQTWRAHARRLTIWTSVMLSVATQTIVALREYRNWDPTVSGHCYVGTGVGNNFGQNLFWLAGTCIYAIVLTISLWSPSRKWWDENVNLKLEPSLRLMRSWLTEARAQSQEYRQNTALRSSQSKFRQFATFGYLQSRTASYALAWVTWWALVQFLSIWCAGNTSSTIELITYSIFLGFLTWWILFLKIQNLHLIRGNEGKWTVGQTIQVVLVILIVFESLDGWAKIKKRRRRSRSSPG